MDMEPQQAFLLRMAGGNIYKICDDTTQLSTRRGGSLMLRDAVKSVAKKFTLQSISSGASEGLFELQAADRRAAIALRGQIADYLNRHDDYRHLNFVVDIAPYPNTAGFNPAKEAAIARNRFRQFQQPTLALPDWSDDPNAGPCAWDNLRPMVDDGERVRRQGDPCRPDTSRSVTQRHDYGRRQKKTDFIRDETGLTGISVSNDLHEIADAAEFGNLHNKLAVIYLDGNGFSGIQRECASPNTLQDFDQRIQGLRRDFLRHLIEWALCDQHFVNHDKDNALRLEILLWGGDEMALIVPAWKGFETLQFFYQHSKSWTFEIEDDSRQRITSHPLTHAGGLVFCQVKTPIQRMQALAEDLANTVKAAPGGREGNCFDYLVLESIDIPGEPPERIRASRYGASIGSVWRPLQALPDWERQTADVATLLDELPRRQLFRIASAATRGSREFEQSIASLEQLKGRQALQSWQTTLQAVFPGVGDRWQWLHLAELWDYLIPEQTLEQEPNDQVAQTTAAGDA
jgi:hypothetical protein